MKELPKEFQFKCDEHSLEQCKKLGIETNVMMTTCSYYSVINNRACILGRKADTIPLISLADYIEPEADQSTLILDKLDKIIQLLENIEFKIT